MTVAVNDTIERYQITGVGPYPYTWRIFNNADLQVYALSTASPPVPTLLTYLTHYTVAGANDAAGGSITLTAAALAAFSGYTLDIRANTPRNQPASIRNIARFLPEIHEDAYDYLDRQIQDMGRLVDASVRAPDNELPLSLTLPPVASRASRYPVFDALGQVTTSAGTGNDPALRADLASAVSGSDGSRLVNFRRTEAGSVARRIYDRMRETLSVRDFGATGDGVTDDAPFFATAIVAAIASGAALYIPPPEPGQFYKWSSGVSVPLASNFRMFGAGKTISIIKASGVFTTALTIGTLIGQQIRGNFEGFNIDLRSATVQYGIKGQRVEEHDFENVSVYGALTSGFSIGYGYVNNYKFCEASYGLNGFDTNVDYLSGANNILSYIGCMALNNTGIGFKSLTGFGVNYIGCIIEQCDKAGILCNVRRGVVISGCYFERNGGTGIAFTTPAQTVKADIVLNGSANDTDMSSAFASEGVVIEGCTTQPLVTSNAFVWNAGANGISITSCHTANPGYVPVLAEMYSSAYKGQNARISNCSTFTTQVAQVSPAAAVNNIGAAYIKVDCPTSVISARNYADKHLAGWQVNVSGGNAATLTKSATAGRTKLRGCDVYVLNTAIAGTSLARGIQLTATDYPELNGKLMWFGIWVYVTDVNCYAVPYTNQQTFNNNPTPINTWTFLAVSFPFPAAGTVDLGVRIAGSNTGNIWCAAPMLCEVGFPNSEAIALVPNTYQSQIEGSVVFDPPNLADGAGTTTTVTVPGLSLGDVVSASFSLDLQGITVTAWCSATDTASVRFQNESGGALDLASGTLRARGIKV